VAVEVGVLVGAGAAGLVLEGQPVRARMDADNKTSKAMIEILFMVFPQRIAGFEEKLTTFYFNILDVTDII
jgi:hypothetical protein